MQISKSHVKGYVLPVLKKSTLGYIAGIFDGEAHIRMWEVRKTSVGVNYGFEIQVAQKDREVLDLMQEWLNVGRVRQNSSTGVYYLEIKRRMAIYGILVAVLPYLVVKRKIAQKIVQHIGRVYGKVATHG